MWYGLARLDIVITIIRPRTKATPSLKSYAGHFCVSGEEEIESRQSPIRAKQSRTGKHTRKKLLRYQIRTYTSIQPILYVPHFPIIQANHQTHRVLDPVQIARPAFPSLSTVKANLSTVNRHLVSYIFLSHIHLAPNVNLS